MSLCMGMTNRSPARVTTIGKPKVLGTPSSIGDVGGLKQAPVKLQVQSVRVGRVEHHFVDAAADLGVGLASWHLGQALVADLPAFAAVVGAEHANRRHRHPHAARIVWVDQNGMQAQPATTRRPAGPGWVLRQPRHLFPGPAAIAAHEQAGLFDAGVECVGLGVMPRDELPDMLECEATVLLVARATLHLGPIRAEIVADSHGGTIDEVACSSVHTWGMPAIAKQAVDFPAAEMRPGHTPLAPTLIGVEEERSFGSSNQHDHLVRHYQPPRNFCKSERKFV